MEKIVIYETESLKLGTRRHMFDWKIGEVISTNGEDSEIINIIDSTLLPKVNSIMSHYKYQSEKIMDSVNFSVFMNQMKDDGFFNDSFKKFFKEFLNLKINNIPSSPSKEEIKKVLDFLYEDTVKKLMAL